jgi:hypothetical protein
MSAMLGLRRILGEVAFVDAIAGEGKLLLCAGRVARKQT